VTFSAPTAGSASSNAAAVFGPATSSAWTGVVAVSITDASTSGNILYYNPIATRNVAVGDTLTFGTGNVTISMS
jgi:hypothetical protein